MGERSKWRVGFLLCAMLLLLGVVPVQAAAKKNLAKANIKLGTTSYTYNGKKRTPKVTVKYGKKTLKKNRDYTVSYRNNQYTGKATVQIKGKGSYQGTRKLSFTIRAGKMITVKLNSCGGEALQSLERPHGGTYGALPEPVKEGYSFQGWYTAKSGGKQVIPAQGSLKEEPYSLCTLAEGQQHGNCMEGIAQGRLFGAGDGWYYR